MDHKDKARLTRILVEGNKSIWENWAEDISRRHEVTEVKPARRSLVMVKVRDSVSQQPFYIGEALISECAVKVDGVAGFGAVMGDCPEHARSLAVIDATFNACLPEVEEWLPVLAEQEKLIEKRQRQDYAAVAKTKVDFSTMEDYDGKGR